MKKLAALILVMSLCMSLCACGNGSEEPFQEETTEATMPTVADLIEQSETETTEVSSETTMPVGEDPVEETVPDETQKQEITTATRDAISRAQSIDDYGVEITAEGLVKFTLEETYFAEDIRPSAPDGSYRYISGSGEEGNTYFIIRGVIENISGREIDFDTISLGFSPTVTLFIYDDTHIYGGNWVVEEPDGSDITSKLPAGETTNLYIFAGIPDDMADSTNGWKVLTGFSDLDETVVALGSIDWDLCDHLYYITLPSNRK